MIYHNCVYHGHKVLSTILTKYAKGTFYSKHPWSVYLCMYQFKFAIVTNIVSNINRTINKFLPIPLFILLDKDYYKVLYFI